MMHASFTSTQRGENDPIGKPCSHGDLSNHRNFRLDELAVRCPLELGHDLADRAVLDQLFERQPAVNPYPAL